MRLHNGKRITAALVGIGLCFVLIGCAEVYRAAGMSDEQAAEQIDRDREALLEAAGPASALAWQLATAGVSAVGAILTALLGKWLGDERKLSAAVIHGVERSAKGNVKQTVQATAETAGVQEKLAKRVQKLTG